jgi:hypothetical protein
MLGWSKASEQQWFRVQQVLHHESGLLLFNVIVDSFTSESQTAKLGLGVNLPLLPTDKGTHSETFVDGAAKLAHHSTQYALSAL